MPNVQHILDERVAAAMRAAFPDAPDSPAIVMPCPERSRGAAQDSRFGDYQANGAMALAKRLKQKPRDVAERILAHLDVSDPRASQSSICEKPEIAGPGFINLRLRPDWVSHQLGEINKVPENTDDRLGVPRAGKPERVVVDYSAPNLAKEMHVGHLRSTIIGDALVRMLDFAGHTVIKQNHVGDWGTQFGMLVAYLDFKKLIVPDPTDPNRFHANVEALEDLEVLYQEAKRLFDTDPDFARESRECVVKLQRGEPRTLAIWRDFLLLSMGHCKKVYEKLGVRLADADIRGESAYNDDLPKVVEALTAKGMLKPSEGAQCVFVKDASGKPRFVAKDGTPLPLIVQKSDEGYLYSTTDLAAIRYRVGQLKAGRILYVVDARQALHFAMVFAVARAAGFAPAEVALEHVAFGTMMGADGRPFKTREGGTVKLMDLLDEAEKRAYDLVSEKSADVPEAERRRIARIVGIGAVKYADLAQNRTSDYVFSWEKMLALDGNTAPYMQYAYARIRSIFRKGEHAAESLHQEAGPIALAAPQELALGKAILRFPEVLDRALEDCRPNILAAYLYDLAGAFTAFYDACPVIQSPEPLRSERLKLCDLAARVIERGLGLLGIETAERM
jgi:arginyl-tRNA synthetase